MKFQFDLDATAEQYQVTRYFFFFFHKRVHNIHRALLFKVKLI